MPNYRESLPSTLESGLQEAAGDDIRPVDRLRAFSFSPRTGTLLWRLMYDLDSSVYNDLVIALVHELENIPRSFVELALHEYLSPQCKRCNGSKSLILKTETGADKRQDCPTCQGTGKHRYSDADRAAYLRVSVQSVRRKAKKIARVTELLSGYDRQVNWKMGLKLSDS